jgi:hypothetical protein
VVWVVCGLFDLSDDPKETSRSGTAATSVFNNMVFNDASEKIRLYLSLLRLVLMICDATRIDRGYYGHVQTKCDFPA